MRRIPAFGLSILLCGCGVSPEIIKFDSMSFGEVIEDTTNKLLVVNVLRARDKAPLHFADIPVIRESMQQTSSIAVLNFGTGAPPPARRRVTPERHSVGFQFSPSFELTHLQSKDFITGISSPIDPKIVKYWLDRGLDRRIVLLLFFSAAEIVETGSEKRPGQDDQDHELSARCDRSDLGQGRPVQRPRGAEMRLAIGFRALPQAPQSGTDVFRQHLPGTPATREGHEPRPRKGQQEPAGFRGARPVKGPVGL